MLGIGLQQQLLLIAFGALVIAIDGALEQIESLQPPPGRPLGRSWTCCSRPRPAIRRWA